MSYSSAKPAIDAEAVVWFEAERVRTTPARSDEEQVGVSLGRMGTRFLNDASEASLSASGVQVSQAAIRAGAVIGNVVSVDEASVLCELRADGRLIEVALPRALFPDGVRWGTPISVRMQNVDGFRTPVVEVREAQYADDPRINEMESLIAELPG